MTYNKQQLKDWAKDAEYIEIYQYSDRTRRLHGDFVRDIDEGEDAIENLPYDEDGFVDVDIEMMDGEEYDNTICANSCVSHKEWMEEGERVAVIVVRDWAMVYDREASAWISGKSN